MGGNQSSLHGLTGVILKCSADRSCASVGAFTRDPDGGEGTALLGGGRKLGLLCEEAILAVDTVLVLESEGVSNAHCGLGLKKRFVWI